MRKQKQKKQSITAEPPKKKRKVGKIFAIIGGLLSLCLTIFVLLIGYLSGWVVINFICLLFAIPSGTLPWWLFKDPFFGIFGQN